MCICNPNNRTPFCGKPGCEMPEREAGCLEPKKYDISEDLENRFSYHSPKPDQIGKYERIRDMAKEFAYLIRDNCPDSREASLAITKIEESVFWANASIAREK
ncbi:MAG: hypothetical protein K0Q47_116 [Sedimentibacter sp.]|jgi:hypothetical protein|nr:hypothetical protein [Sedimentibacter sp.]